MWYVRLLWFQATCQLETLWDYSTLRNKSSARYQDSTQSRLGSGYDFVASGTLIGMLGRKKQNERVLCTLFQHELGLMWGRTYIVQLILCHWQLGWFQPHWKVGQGCWIHIGVSRKDRDWHPRTDGAINRHCYVIEHAVRCERSDLELRLYYINWNVSFTSFICHLYDTG